MNDWQSWAAPAVVMLAALFLSLRFFKKRGSGKGAGCGGSCGCGQKLK